MPADRERLETILAEVTLQIEGREEALRQYLGERVNLESPKQLVRALGDTGCLLTDTSEATLVKISHPVAKRLLAYRESIKVKQQALTLLKSIATTRFMPRPRNRLGPSRSRPSRKSKTTVRSDCQQSLLNSA